MKVTSVDPRIDPSWVAGVTVLCQYEMNGGFERVPAEMADRSGTVRCRCPTGTAGGELKLLAGGGALEGARGARPLAQPAARAGGGGGGGGGACARRRLRLADRRDGVGVVGVGVGVGEAMTL